MNQSPLATAQKVVEQQSNRLKIQNEKRELKCRSSAHLQDILLNKLKGQFSELHNT